jgi:hypothetical protein
MSPDEPMYGARRLTLWLERVAELAHVAFGALGFDDQLEPIRLAPLGATSATSATSATPGMTPDRPLIRRRLAGMRGAGGTRFAPALGAAIAALAAQPAERKLLITVIDGALEDVDAEDSRTLIAALPRSGIGLLPLYLGDDPEVIAGNTALFGRLLACPTMSELMPLTRAWLRAAQC